MKFKPQGTEIYIHPRLHLFAGVFFVKSFFIPNNNIKCMSAFQYKLFRQQIKIYIVKIIPNAQQRYYILFTNFFSYPLFYQIFISKARFNRRGIVQLQPLNFFGKSFGIFPINFSPVLIFNHTFILRRMQGIKYFLAVKKSLHFVYKI